MSDAEEFTSSENNQLSKDPVAVFLIREQSQLAQLDENFGGFNLSEDQVEANDFCSSHAYGTVTTSTTSAGTSPSHGYDGHRDYGQTEDQYGVTKTQDRQRQEPEKIRRWREEQLENLLKKDAESEKKKAEWREIAKRELEEWYKHREELLDKAKKTHRESQDAFVEERDEKKPGGEWERICRHCDFNPKGSRNMKDVSRLRSILLQLKQVPVERQ